MTEDNKPIPMLAERCRGYKTSDGKFYPPGQEVEANKHQFHLYVGNAISTDPATTPKGELIIEEHDDLVEFVRRNQSLVSTILVNIREGLL